MRIQYRNPLVIGLSFLFAIMLTMLPLPAWAIWFRPEWVALVLIYWVMALPFRVGVGCAFAVGLLLDVSGGTLMGEHAFALSVIAYLVQHIYSRIRVFHLPQQALSIFIIIIFYQALLFWMQGLIGQMPITWEYWLRSLTSMLLWPWVFVLLRDCRRRYHVT